MALLPEEDDMNATRRGMMGLAVGMAAPGLATTALAASAPVLAEHPMIARLWHGRTTADKADEYRQYLFEAGVKKIAALPGNRGVQMMVAKTLDQGDFTVISYWDSIAAIKAYAGEDYAKVHDLPRDNEFLIDREPRVHHLSLDVNLWQN
jgi:heme-degrading monooxygenase HmoA